MVNGTIADAALIAVAVGDITQLPDLLHGAETVLYGDQAYWSEFHRTCAKAAGVCYRVNRRAGGSKTLTAVQKRLNRSRSRTRARGEHAFRIVKHLWGFHKVRYRGLAKNLAQAQVAFALANLYALRRQLLPPHTRCAW